MQLYPDHVYAAMDVLQKADQLHLHIPYITCSVMYRCTMNIWGCVSGSCFWHSFYRHIDLLMTLTPSTRKSLCVHHIKLPWNSKCKEPSCRLHAPTI